MSGTVGPLEYRQRYADLFETIQTHLDGRQAQMHTMMPGRIVSFDAQTMTATVQPSLQAFHTQTDGSVQPLSIGQITEVPVHFPGGGGHVLTFPVKAGDDCMLMFAERSIDNWHQHGGEQQPSDWRMHDINDAICHVGLRSQAGLPSGGANPDMVELRSDDGNTVVQIDGANGAVKITAQKVTLDGDAQIGKSKLGMLGTAPIDKGTITGSKQGNQALTSLLLFLKNRGDINDLTT